MNPLADVASNLLPFLLVGAIYPASFNHSFWQA